jgi:hypothetical protein
VAKCLVLVAPFTLAFVSRLGPAFVMNSANFSTVAHKNVCDEVPPKFENSFKKSNRLYQ